MRRSLTFRKWTKSTALTTEPDMATRNEQWLEDLDNLIWQVPSLFLPEPVRDSIMSKLETLQEEIQEQIELRSTDWEA
jgi:hypothetical protein